MDRKDFLQLFVLGTAAAATGCLGACSKDESTGPTTGAANVDFTVDLAAAASASLVAGTGYVYSSDNAVIVAKTSAGSYVAVQAPCTHEGVRVTFNSSRQQFFCAQHSAYFSPTGAVVSGPPPRALKQYTVTQTGNSLRITG
ncbi:QcrA and Rieske domain-containing protein [Hymenobacter perfusus]|uniref:Rieske (2Fe-2S) protein n=1 Tax=Hymenobacter perfusus TaxID=1236770 RepID=A0A3R9PPH2_9BACT|nr:Rieske (2Fe-2S) protein [Hymenobacter perfusus]RSK42991.1 Rieske (2Fe-2S) protein [Hymenobacter perfusus]